MSLSLLFPFLLFLFCPAAPLGNGVAFAGQWGLAVSGAARPAMAFLAEATPSAEALGSSAQVGYWWVVAAIAVINLVVLIRPQPALHRQFADREETKEAMRDATAAMKELGEKFERYSTDHYNSRRRMHSRINALENGLAFIVGKMTRDKDPDADRLQSLLTKAAPHAEDSHHD